jgi:hypothetical protein
MDQTWMYPQSRQNQVFYNNLVAFIKVAQDDMLRKGETKICCRVQDAEIWQCSDTDTARFTVTCCNMVSWKLIHGGQATGRRLLLLMAKGA